VIGSRLQTAKGGARGAKDQRVGFIGLGNIGLPMAKNIADAGFALTVFDVNPESMRHVAASGARLAENPAAVGRECAIIGVCVRDDHDVRQVLLGDDGLLGSAQADAIIAIHSTIRTRTVLEVAAIGSERGVHVLDVGITGGAPGATAKTLCYMAGGEAVLIDRCRPVFETSANGPGGLSDAQREWFVGLAEKDLAITLEFARDLGVSLPATALCSQLMVDVGGLKERRSQH
jgi:3-hydroxyisobutyrate dehydrogenase